MTFLQTPENSSIILGRLESAVMEVLWSQGECQVRDVVQVLEKPLAYTTVMSTMDRLYKKGVLDRRKVERAFLYSPKLSRHEWVYAHVRDFVTCILAKPAPTGHLLASSFVEAVGQEDEALLDELEKKIEAKRQELRDRRNA